MKIMTEKLNQKQREASSRGRRRYSSFPPRGSPDQSPINVKTPVVNYSLPTVSKPQKTSTIFQSISPKSLAAEMRNISKRLRLIIIDCRYPFEYFGGHIKGAINIYNSTELERYFYTDHGIQSTLEGLLPVFYCEFSQMRGPNMACELRKIDIRQHKNELGILDFPEIYLLDRGYKSFWMNEGLRNFCEPRGYVSMHYLPYRHILRQYDQHRRSKSVGIFARNGDGRERNKIFSECDLRKEPPKNEPKTPRTRLSFE